jgi:adenylate cyclase
MRGTGSWQVGATLLLILFLSWGYLFIPQHFHSLDNRLRDFLFILRGPLPDTGNVVIVDIDEKSLRTEGQWPWSRDTVAHLLYNLSESGAGIIGLDIVFAEPDRTSPRTIAQTIGIPSGELEDYDQTLSQIIQNTPVIGGYFFLFDKGGQSEGPLVPAVFIEKGSGQGAFIPEPLSLTPNIPIIQEAFFSSGFFNNIPDPGGMVRHVPLVMRFDMTIYPSLAMEMIRIYHDVSEVIVNNSEIGVSRIDVGELHIPTDRFGRLSVNFRGPDHQFTYLSATDILSGSFDPAAVAGKFILIGTSAVGLSDLRSTPFDSVMPGVEVHANVIDDLLRGEFLHRSPHSELYDLLLITAAVITGVLLFTLLNEWLILPVFFGLLYALYLLFSTLLFDYGLIMNILFPTAGLIFAMILSVAIDYIVTSVQKRAVMSSFAKKVSPAVMHDLIKRNETGFMQATEREVSIFFSDVRAFTTISEQLGSPKRLIELLNDYMTPMVDIIIKQEGTVDKFIGDAIMAYWNAPNDVVDHADKAVRSAIEQINVLHALNSQLQKRFGLEINIGIGIDTGIATVGEMGSQGRSDYTIIGDHVNLASRLEGLNKLYGTTIIISSFTKAQLKDNYLIRPLDIVRVKGKREAVEIYEVIAREPDTQLAKELETYAEALLHYREHRLQKSAELFETLHRTHTESTLYALYSDRCQKLMAAGNSTYEIITDIHNK